MKGRLDLSNKPNLLYDAAVLIQKIPKTGIGNVALNILKQLCSSNKFNIYLYAHDGDHTDLQSFKDLHLNSYDVKLLKRSPHETIENNIFRLMAKKGRAKQNRQLISQTKYSLRIFFWEFIRWVFLPFNKTTEFDNIDIFFSPALTPPQKILKNNLITRFTILYDCIPLLLKSLYPGMARSDHWFYPLLSSLNPKDHYFAISESAKNDFMNFCPQLSPENITVTPLACDSTYTPKRDQVAQTLKKYNLSTEGKYIFSLCTIEPRKNLIRAARTFIEFIKRHNIHDMVFILAGADINLVKFTECLKIDFPDFEAYDNKIIKVGYIDDEDLAPLYSGAEWFVYTSQYEGFGLPPLEAMACGCPVIVSNNSSLPEVVGDSGIMIDWDSDQQHIQAYEKYYFDTDFRHTMAQKGIERAKQFSWDKCADTMIHAMLTETDSMPKKIDRLEKTSIRADGNRFPLIEKAP